MNDQNTDVNAQLSIVSPEKVRKMDEVATQYEMAMAGTNDKFTRAFMTAQAMQQLRELMTPDVMKPVMAMMNTTLGFRTDQDPNRPKWNPATKKMETPKPYTVEVVRECAIEAILSGVQLIGNQFNIIAANCYLPKNGLSHKLRNLDGLKDLEIGYDVPKMASSGEGAIVTCRASWRYNGVPGKLEAQIPIKVNKMMGSDAILGKAERKMKARIWSRLTDTEVEEGDVDDIPAGARDVTGTAPKDEPKVTYGEEKDEVPRVPASAPRGLFDEQGDESPAPPDDADDEQEPDESNEERLVRLAAENDIELETLEGWMGENQFSLGNAAHCQKVITAWPTIVKLLKAR